MAEAVALTLEEAVGCAEPFGDAEAAAGDTAGVAAGVTEPLGVAVPVGEQGVKVPVGVGVTVTVVLAGAVTLGTTVPVVEGAAVVATVAELEGWGVVAGVLLDCGVGDEVEGAVGVDEATALGVRVGVGVAVPAADAELGALTPAPITEPMQRVRTKERIRRLSIAITSLTCSRRLRLNARPR